MPLRASAPPSPLTTDPHALPLPAPQVFESMNKALKLSCTKGLPVRVVRSYKEKRSSYAPTEETPVRYDGIYRIVKCWRTKGKQVGARRAPTGCLPGLAGARAGRLAGWLVGGVHRLAAWPLPVSLPSCRHIPGPPPAPARAHHAVPPLPARLLLLPLPQGYLVCRYLFVRCDNEPASWSSDGAPRCAAGASLSRLDNSCTAPCSGAAVSTLRPCCCPSSRCPAFTLCSCCAHAALRCAPLAAGRDG